MVKFKVIRYFQHEKVVRKYLEHYTFFESVYDQLPEEVKLNDGFDIRALMEKGINKLPPRCGEAFRMRWSEGLSNGEIAERMNLSKETIENYISTAIKQLREIFRKSPLTE